MTALRILLLLIIFTVIDGVARPQSPPQESAQSTSEPQSSENDENRESDAEASSSSSLSAKFLGESPADSGKEDGGPEGIADGTRDQHSTDWTKVQAITGVVATIFSLIATFGLVWSLLLNRRATVAAESAVQVTREIAIAQNRAYLSAKPVHVDVGLKGSSLSSSCDRVQINLKFETRNSGITPAFDIGVQFLYSVTETVQPVSNAYDQPLKSFPPSSGQLNNGDTRDQTITDVIEVPKFGLHHGKELRVTVLFEYRDIYGNKHLLEIYGKVEGFFDLVSYYANGGPVQPPVKFEWLKLPRDQ